MVFDMGFAHLDGQGQGGLERRVGLVAVSRGQLGFSHFDSRGEIGFVECDALGKGVDGLIEGVGFHEFHTQAELQEDILGGFFQHRTNGL